MTRFFIVLFASALLGGCVIAPLGYHGHRGYGHGHHIDKHHHGGDGYGYGRHGGRDWDRGDRGRRGDRR